MFREGQALQEEINKAKKEEMGFEELDEIYETLDEFEKNKFSEEINNEWIKEYGNDPTKFFDDENIKKLKNLPDSQRLIFLAKSSRYITITPDMATKYYKEFPNDLKAVNETHFS